MLFWKMLKVLLFLKSVKGNYSDDESLWATRRDEFIKICDNHAPLKTIRVKDRYCPWMSSDIVKLMYKRDFLKFRSILPP